MVLDPTNEVSDRGRNDGDIDIDVLNVDILLALIVLHLVLGHGHFRQLLLLNTFLLFNRDTQVEFVHTVVFVVVHRLHTGALPGIVRAASEDTPITIQDVRVEITAQHLQDVPFWLVVPQHTLACESVLEVGV